MMGTLGRVVILEGHLHMSVPAWEKLCLLALVGSHLPERGSRLDLCGFYRSISHHFPAPLWGDGSLRQQGQTEETWEPPVCSRQLTGCTYRSPGRVPHHRLHFTDEETKAQRSEVICSGHMKKKWLKQAFKWCVCKCVSLSPGWGQRKEATCTLYSANAC